MNLTEVQTSTALKTTAHVIALAVGALGAVLEQAHHHDDQERAARKEPALQPVAPLKCSAIRGMGVQVQA